MGLLPIPMPPHAPTARDNCSDLDPSLNQLGSSTTTKPLCSSKLSYLSHVCPSQRLTTLLCLWSWTFLFLLSLPMASGTKAICYFPPPKRLSPFPLEDASPGWGSSPRPAEAPGRAPLWRQKRLWGAEYWHLLPIRRRATCFTRCCKLWNKILSRMQIRHPKQRFAAWASTSGKAQFLSIKVLFVKNKEFICYQKTNFINVNKVLAFFHFACCFFF